MSVFFLFNILLFLCLKNGNIHHMINPTLMPSLPVFYDIYSRIKEYSIEEIQPRFFRFSQNIKNSIADGYAVLNIGSVH